MATVRIYDGLFLMAKYLDSFVSYQHLIKILNTGLQLILCTTYLKPYLNLSMDKYWKLYGGRVLTL